MQLIEYLEQLNKELPQGTQGPEIQKPQRVGPKDVLRWAQTNKGSITRGDANVGLLNSMYKTFGASANNTTQILLTPTGGYAVLYGKKDGKNPYESYATAINNCTTCDPDVFYKPPIVKATKMFCGFGLNLEKWGYPACRHYYTASSTEAQDCFSRDFCTKHISSTSGDKSSKRAATIRATPLAERNVTAFGSIVTSRSGAIAQDQKGAFQTEIRSRQAEFTATHAGLCNYYAENFATLVDGGKKAFPYIDSITFITKRKFAMYEYEASSGTVHGGMGDFYIHFSVSATQDGQKWVVHHLATTADSRTVPQGKTALSTLAIDGADAGSYAVLP